MNILRNKNRIALIGLYKINNKQYPVLDPGGRGFGVTGYAETLPVLLTDDFYDFFLCDSKSIIAIWAELRDSIALVDYLATRCDHHARRIKMISCLTR